jgi:hypothetical protein
VEAGGGAFLVDTGYLVQRPLELGARAARAARAVADEPLLLPAGRRTEGLPRDLPPGDFDLFTREREPEGLRWRYRLVASPPTREDFAAHWRRSFSLPGMRSLVVTRRDGGGRRLYLHNHKLRRQGGAGAGASTENVRRELELVVERSFGIDPRVTRRARELIARQRARGRSDGAAR